MDSTSQHNEISTDLLIIGGGAAGLWAAITALEQAPELDVTIIEKAHVHRSGCLAMGLNAINLHLGENASPQNYVDYVAADNYGVVRRDLLHSIARNADRAAPKLESLGIPFPKDPHGNYVRRSARSIVMHGERVKPTLAQRALELGARVFNHTAVTNLIQGDDGGINGAQGLHLHSRSVIRVSARATFITTGGASGIYKPNSPGSARKKTWYCPYNAGGGLALGIEAGAEMTSFEMRFIALRTKDVIAPTGTLAFLPQSEQLNNRNEPYLDLRKRQLGRGLTTSERLLATIDEHRQGNAPCVVTIDQLSEAEYDELIRSYLQMAPAIVLLLKETPDADEKRIEVTGSEPYVNGGHGMGGFWVDINRRTSLPRLYAAGDAAGGAPKKYLSGAFAEAQIAVEDALQAIPATRLPASEDRMFSASETRGETRHGDLTPYQIEERLQKIMDEYAGGASSFYETSEGKLQKARAHLASLEQSLNRIRLEHKYDMLDTIDMRHRILTAQTLVEHLTARRESRWPCYQSRADFPVRNDVEYKCFINSKKSQNGQIQCFQRELEPPFSLLGKD